MVKRCAMICVAVLALFAAGTAIWGKLETQNGLFSILFRPDLQKASDGFYGQYLSDDPYVASYMAKVISLKRDDNAYQIKFGIYPYFGPHWPVGYDEVEFAVDNGGTITLLNFSHKKNYELPERLGIEIKKLIPTK